MNLREWARATHHALASRPSEVRQDEFMHAHVEAVLRIALFTLGDALARGDSLQIESLGHLWVQSRPARRTISHLGGMERSHALPARRVVRFRASACLDARLNATGLVDSWEES